MSCNPNTAAVTERNPHFAATQNFCLTTTCNWSPAAQEKRSQESAARACVNGCWKIKTELTLLRKVATDSPHLRDILSGLRGLNGPTSLLSSAPLVLNYLKAKVDLLVKHVKHTNMFDMSHENARKPWCCIIHRYFERF